MSRGKRRRPAHDAAALNSARPWLLSVVIGARAVGAVLIGVMILGGLVGGHPGGYLGGLAIAGAAWAQDGTAAAPAAAPEPAGAPDGAAAERGVPVAAVAPHLAPVLGQPPVQPRHPAAAKAYVVLETYCARCHQSGKAPPAAGTDLANILELDQIARVPSLVRPGNPEASEIYRRMLAHPEMPLTGESRAGADPTAPEIEAVREWIEDLGPRAEGSSGCGARPFLGDDEIAAGMRTWLEQVGAEAARDTRFLSLAHLRNACATDAELAAYRQAVAKVLNGLSWSPTRAKVEAIGDTLSLLAVRLGDLGWLPAHWEKLAAAYPRGTIGDVPAAVTEAVGTAVPVLRADWLASTAMRAPLYYELIGLPATLDELGDLLGLDLGPASADTVPDPAVTSRLALRASAVTGGARIVERQAAKGRPVWTAYEVAARTDGREVLDQPLGPLAGGEAGKPGAQPAATFSATGARVMFALPNGLPAFGVYDGEGQRLDRATGATRGTGRHRSGGVAGLGCAGCHGGGVVKAVDAMRAHLDGDKFGGDAKARDAARRIYPGAAAMQALIEADGHAFRRATVQAGIDPDVEVHGLELATGLARQYDLDVGLERAAAEFGLEPAAFVERLKSFDGPEAGQILALRLRHGPLPRAAAERLFVALRTGRGPDAAAGSAVPPTGADDGGAASRLSLALWSEAPSYHAGELFAVQVAPSADCHLTLISVDAGGRATVLFPNDFDQDNLVRGGRIHRIPAKSGPYQLRLKDRGRETVVAICDARQKTPDGIEHDFERQRFTVLGNWRNFLRTAAEEAAGVRRDPERAARSRGRKQARAGKSETATDAARPEPDARPEGTARAAIQITVE